MTFAEELRDKTIKARAFPYEYRRKLDEEMRVFKAKCVECAEQKTSRYKFLFLEMEENKYVPEARRLIKEKLEMEGFVDPYVSLAGNDSPYRIEVEVEWFNDTPQKASI